MSSLTSTQSDDCPIQSDVCLPAGIPMDCRDRRQATELCRIITDDPALQVTSRESDMEEDGQRDELRTFVEGPFNASSQAASNETVVLDDSITYAKQVQQSDCASRGNICDLCGKACKNKHGRSVHMSKCKKNHQVQQPHGLQSVTGTIEEGVPRP